jgi:hypothetical protein
VTSSATTLSNMILGVEGMSDKRASRILAGTIDCSTYTHSHTAHQIEINCSFAGKYLSSKLLRGGKITFCRAINLFCLLCTRCLCRVFQFTPPRRATFPLFGVLSRGKQASELAGKLSSRLGSESYHPFFAVYRCFHHGRAWSQGTGKATWQLAPR